MPADQPHGVLLLDKPAGYSSTQALARAKRFLQASKAGHTGTLDPFATGLLPLVFGEATKFSQYLLDADKVYLSTFVLGAVTDTGDAEGQLQDVGDASAITESDVIAALRRFEGEIEQVPSMFSAIKQNGQPLYKLARQGLEVERKPRAVVIKRLELRAFRAGGRAEVDIELECSKGTYVRTLVEDLAAALDTLGHVEALRR